jgi:hypothetical protein
MADVSAKDGSQVIHRLTYNEYYSTMFVKNGNKNFRKGSKN